MKTYGHLQEARLSQITPSGWLKTMLEKGGTIDTIGEDSVFKSIDKALLARKAKEKAKKAEQEADDLVSRFMF